MTIATLTDAVERFIQHEDLADVDLVGSSMGARMVLEMARRGHGGNVVALDPGGFWSQREVKVFGATVKASVGLIRRIQATLPLLTSNPVARTLLLAQFSAHPWRLEPDLVLTEFRAFKTATSLDEALDALVYGPPQEGAPAGSLTGTVVIGWGRSDKVTLPRQAQRAQRLFPDATLHWFNHCGHFPHWDQPAQTVDLIRQTQG